MNWSTSNYPYKVEPLVMETNIKKILFKKLFRSRNVSADMQTHCSTQTCCVLYFVFWSSVCQLYSTWPELTVLKRWSGSTSSTSWRTKLPCGIHGNWFMRQSDKNAEANCSPDKHNPFPLAKNLTNTVFALYDLKKKLQNSKATFGLPFWHHKGVDS